jgi:hypothetical protein
MGSVRLARITRTGLIPCLALPHVSHVPKVLSLSKEICNALYAQLSLTIMQLNSGALSATKVNIVLSGQLNLSHILIHRPQRCITFPQ